MTGRTSRSRSRPARSSRFKYTLATHLVDVTFTNSDVTPPTTSVALNPAQPDWTGGFSAPVTVTLTGTDESPGTVAVEYRLDGGEWTAYTAPLVVSTPGAHTVEVRATDATGNVSPVVVPHVHDRDPLEHRPRAGRRRPRDARGPARRRSRSLGTFVPGVARDYTAGLNAIVTSTGGDSKLTVSDASTTNTGKLVNGTHALAQPLQVRTGAAAFAPIGGSATPTSLLDFVEPVSGANVPVEFKQSIGANEGLRTGQYSKTLTFTLSTTTP